MFDPSGTWAAGADLVGVARSSCPGPGRGPPAPTSGPGRAVDLARHRAIDRDGNRVFGSLVTLTGTSLLTDLANRPAAGAAAETVADPPRRASPPPPPGRSPRSPPRPPMTPRRCRRRRQATALAALEQLFTSTAGGLHLRPAHPAGRPPPRGAPTPTRCRWPTWPRHSPGRRVHPLPRRLARRRRHRRRRHRAPRHDLPADPGHRQVPRPRHRRHAETVPCCPGWMSRGRGPGGRGRDQLIDTTAACTAATALAALAAEASGWALEAMSWDTAATDGFDTLDQALAAHRRHRTGRGAVPGPLLAARPRHPAGVRGAGRHHRLQARRVAGAVGPRPHRGHRHPHALPGITWEDLDPALVWDETPARPASMTP